MGCPVIKLSCTAWSCACTTPFTNFQDYLEEDEQWRETNLDLNPVCYLWVKCRVGNRLLGVSMSSCGERSLSQRVSTLENYYVYL